MRDDGEGGRFIGYEWSFVAVPAQKNAGVIKQLGGSGKTLAKFVASPGGKRFAGEYGELVKHAELGKRYMGELRSETLRLALLCDRDIHKALERSSSRMDEDELQSLKKSFESRLAEKLPVSTQLPGRDETVRFDGGEYII